MADTPEQIQRQIEDTRAELAATIEQIADRVSPKHVASRGAAAAKDKVNGAFTATPVGGGEASVRWERVGAVAGGLTVVILLRRALKQKAKQAPRKAALRHAREAALRAQKRTAKGKPVPAKKRAVKKAAHLSAELHVALEGLQKAIAEHTPGL